MNCIECAAEVPASPSTGRVSKWYMMRAQSLGWFFQKDGTAYCPRHVPGWVAEWRAKRGTTS